MVAYLPQNLRQGGKQARDAKQEPDVPDYDQDAASLFWGLQVPRELCPEDPRKLEDKLGFCVQLIKDWDPRLYESLHPQLLSQISRTLANILDIATT